VGEAARPGVGLLWWGGFGAWGLALVHGWSLCLGVAVHGILVLTEEPGLGVRRRISQRNK